MKSEEVNHREQEDPDEVHEVPEKATHLNAVNELLRIGLPHLGSGEGKITQHESPTLKSATSGT
jgi:hypothetical protein